MGASEADRPKATTVVKLADGKKYELRFERRHLYRMERETGQTLFETFDALQRGSYAAMVDLVWAGLLHADPDLTTDQVADDLLGMENLPEVAEALAQALDPVTGSKGKKAAEGNPTTEASEKTGAGSGQPA